MSVYEMKTVWAGTVLATALLCGAVAWAQAPASQPAQQQPAKPTQETNPFPEDNGSVPVLPNAESPGSAAPAPTPDAETTANIPLPGEDADPVRSPDDAGQGTGGDSGMSSSSAGVDTLLQPPPDTDTKGRKHKKGDDAEAAEDVPHPPTAKENESVGSYYLETRNWKGALSRFQSALVLDPENPDVYWGLAEAQRHLGEFAAAKGNYEKVMEYDPDSRHAKEAKKLLASPELASAAAQPQTAAPQ